MTQRRKVKGTSEWQLEESSQGVDRTEPPASLRESVTAMGRTGEGATVQCRSGEEANKRAGSGESLDSILPPA